ncbi:hypothetical protein McpSp1_15580 [Methanocorpusculaceae archaeon Sp1]|uniref:ACT domain-containing protein n=1 Tax=Methanorbis furvi TaxID=3028299 RepID=A0AAE4MDK4_9EURY|nr:hypothetical protein [Methanocorpusculaceae archaeon Sp1]MDV0441553.1 hypothetical protein [Methanocorpusculaceae archaeon Ag1]
MQISLKLELSDKPGQLLAAIKPVSDSGANIISIMHQRDAAAGDGTLIVDIVVTLPQNRLGQLESALRSNGIEIIRIGTDHLTCTKTFILIGHILHTDLTDTINRIDKANVAEVTELHMVMPGITQPSTAKLTIKAAGSAEMDQACEILVKIAEEKHLLIIDEEGGLA